MLIETTFRHMDVSPTLKAHAEETIQRDFADFSRVESVHVILEVQKLSHRCEVDVHAKGHVHIEGHDETEDMYKSVNNAVMKAARQLRKSRDKMNDMHGNRVRLTDVEATPPTEIPG